MHLPGFDHMSATMFCTDMVQQFCSCSALPAPKTEVIVAQTATRQLCLLLCWIYTWVKKTLGLLQQSWSCGGPCPAVALILWWSHTPVRLQEGIDRHAVQGKVHPAPRTMLSTQPSWCWEAQACPPLLLFIASPFRPCKPGIL